MTNRHFTNSLHLGAGTKRYTTSGMHQRSQLVALQPVNIDRNNAAILRTL